MLLFQFVIAILELFRNVIFFTFTKKLLRRSYQTPYSFSPILYIYPKERSVAAPQCPTAHDPNTIHPQLLFFRTRSRYGVGHDAKHPGGGGMPSGQPIPSLPSDLARFASRMLSPQGVTGRRINGFVMRGTLSLDSSNNNLSCSSVKVGANGMVFLFGWWSTGLLVSFKTDRSAGRNWGMSQQLSES